MTSLHSAATLLIISSVLFSTDIFAMKPEEAQALVDQGLPHVEREIARVATRLANEKVFFEKDYGRIEIKASYDVTQGILFLDPGVRFGPESGYPQMEDLHSWIAWPLEPLTERLPNYVRTDWLYGGHDLYQWFPQDRRP